MVVVSGVEATPRRCHNDPWDQVVGSAKVSVAAFAAVSEVDSAAVTEVIEGFEAAATLVVAEAASVEEVSGVAEAAAAATATLAVAEAGLVVVKTATPHQTLPMDPVVDLAGLADRAAVVIGETSPVRAVGMAVTVVVAHMMTGPEATEATVAAEIVATGTIDKPEATWSRCGHAETMGTAAAEITTGLETTTHASVDTKAAATRIPENCDATNRTIPKMSCGGYLRPFSSPFRLSLLLHILPLTPGVSLLFKVC